jgi:hypothetical protein
MSRWCRPSDTNGTSTRLLTLHAAGVQEQAWPDSKEQRKAELALARLADARPMMADCPGVMIATLVLLVARSSAGGTAT